jgi:FixJ family two-component response regulator
LRSTEIDLAQAGTVLIAVGDGVLADSLRFSLELEGFETRFCDEYSWLSAVSAPEARGCLVLDQDVFARMVDGEGEGVFSASSLPVVLMVSHTTQRVLARAEAAGVAEVVEKPLLGGVLFDAIRHVIDTSGYSGPEQPS